MQIAYGVDTDGNNAINRIAAATQSADTNVSSDVDGDEWAPNVPGEAVFTAADFVTANRCPRLHAVMISLVAKSRDPDPTFKGPTSRGLLTMNSPLVGPRSYPASTVTTFRRRVQTLKINLRNYAFEGA
jgi:hypothetical protein